MTMAKVIFTISYDIIPEKREEYLALSKEIKEYLTTVKGREYSVYETKGKKNSFSEIFLFSSLDEYDDLEDQDEKMSDLVARLEPLLQNNKMKYTTLIEIE
jgi:antibiotic biosynthesis monooxygenase (ABM) superfamily enzyme